MRLHLYEFRHPEFGKDFERTQYVLSTLPVKEVRKYYNNWDHGGGSYETFVETFEQGSVREIHSIWEIDPKSHEPSMWQPTVADILPYSTDEPVYCQELGNKWLQVDQVNIAEYFELYYGRIFPDG